MNWIEALFWRHSEEMEAGFLSDSEKVGFMYAQSFEVAPSGMTGPERLEKVRNYYHDRYDQTGA